jgi:hypothetical protein
VLARPIWLRSQAESKIGYRPDNVSQSVTKQRRHNRLSTVLVLALLLTFLAGAAFVGHQGWISAGDVEMPSWGWLMMGLGIVFSLLLGWGLMALIFYSSRAGFDDVPELRRRRRASRTARSSKK